MSGETDLKKLISGMRPALDPRPYVFCSFSEKSMDDLLACDPVGLFLEEEGLTAILAAEHAARLGLAEAEHYCRITLRVHSSLEAVGLTAAVSAVLAKGGIPANVVAAYYHDHIFVPERKAKEALDLLLDMS